LDDEAWGGIEGNEKELGYEDDVMGDALAYLRSVR
jgi:hypothetical protein